MNTTWSSSLQVRCFSMCVLTHCVHSALSSVYVEGGFPIDVNAVVIGQSQEKRSSGDAWVLLDSPAVADDAKRALHKKTIGKRYIELFHASPREADMVYKGHGMSHGRPSHQYHHYDRPSPYGGGGMAGGGAAQWSPNVPHHSRYGGGAPPPYGGAPATPAVYQPPYMNHSSSTQGGGHRGTGSGGLGGRMGMPGNDSNKAVGTHTTVVRMRGLPYYANENHIVVSVCLV